MKGALVVTACIPLPEGMQSALQPYLTTSQSRALYRRFLQDVIETTQDVEGMDFYLAYAPRGTREFLTGIAPPQFKLLCLEGGEVQDRFSGLFKRLLSAGYEQVVVLCANHPDLPSCMIREAVEALDKERHDMVFGPNERGGFYLVGLKRYIASLFKQVDWGSPQFDRQLVRWAQACRVRLHRLPSWYEVKTVDDLRRHLTYYSLRLQSSHEAPSETGRYLSKIKNRFMTLNC